jgi:hypothetical protein
LVVVRTWVNGRKVPSSNQLSSVLTFARRRAVPVLDDVQPLDAGLVGLDADLAGPDVHRRDGLADLLVAQVAVGGRLDLVEPRQRLADRHGRDGGLGRGDERKGERGAGGGAEDARRHETPLMKNAGM